MTESLRAAIEAGHIDAVAQTIRDYLHTECPEMDALIFNADLEGVAMRVWPAVEARVRATVADELGTALAADLADSDVTSGEAIWEQGGYRNGLSAAADIARGEA